MQGGDALLMIDAQNDFCPGGALAVSEGGGVVVQRPRVRLTEIGEELGEVILKMDERPEGLKDLSHQLFPPGPFQILNLVACCAGKCEGEGG